jgi:hypothetical protein
MANELAFEAFHAPSSDSHGSDKEHESISEWLPPAVYRRPRKESRDKQHRDLNSERDSRKVRYQNSHGATRHSGNARQKYARQRAVAVTFELPPAPRGFTISSKLLTEMPTDDGH